MMRPDAPYRGRAYERWRVYQIRRAAELVAAVRRVIALTKFGGPFWLRPFAAIERVALTSPFTEMEISGALARRQLRRERRAEAAS